MSNILRVDYVVCFIMLWYLSASETSNMQVLRMPVIALLMDKVHNLSFFSFYVFIRLIWPNWVWPSVLNSSSHCLENLQCTGHYKGVRLSSGQDLFSHQLILDPSFIVPLPLASSPPDSLRENLQILGLGDVKRKVARGICITRHSLRPDTSNFLVVYPHRCKIKFYCYYCSLLNEMRKRERDWLFFSPSSFVPWTGYINSSSSNR